MPGISAGGFPVKILFRLFVAHMINVLIWSVVLLSIWMLDIQLNSKLGYALMGIPAPLFSLICKMYIRHCYENYSIKSQQYRWLKRISNVLTIIILLCLFLTFTFVTIPDRG